MRHAVQSDGVINLFQDFEQGFSLFDPNFLDKISKMEKKNLAIEILNRLLKDQISSVSRRNLVKGEEFSKRLKRIMEKYREGLIHNAENLDRFTGLADVLGEDDQKYDAGELAKTRERLIDLARETVNSERT